MVLFHFTWSSYWYLKLIQTEWSSKKKYEKHVIFGGTDQFRPQQMAVVWIMTSYDKWTMMRVLDSLAWYKLPIHQLDPDGFNLFFYFLFASLLYVLLYDKQLLLLANSFGTSYQIYCSGFNSRFYSILIIKSWNIAFSVSFGLITWWPSTLTSGVWSGEDGLSHSANLCSCFWGYWAGPTLHIWCHVHQKPHSWGRGCNWGTVSGSLHFITNPSYKVCLHCTLGKWWLRR